MSKNSVDDFGFSLVSEEELKSYEQTLKKQVEEQTKITEKTTIEMQEKLETSQNKLRKLHAAIMPLLNNLSKNPEKDFIHWPDRVEKIQEFIIKINKIAEIG